LLDKFYLRADLPLPRLERLHPEEIPQPYKALLVHSADMTLTLEGFYGRPPGLRVLSRARQGEAYYREVALTLGRAGRPLLYGVIRICLDHLPSSARRRVLAEQRPLGDILLSEAVPHLGWPQDFFRAEADAHIRAVLGLGAPRELYGRRNVLLDGSRRLLAEVIEVLAPCGSRSPLDC
jgi:chorismate-pyruvate lyase